MIRIVSTPFLNLRSVYMTSRTRPKEPVSSRAVPSLHVPGPPSPSRSDRQRPSQLHQKGCHASYDSSRLSGHPTRTYYCIYTNYPRSVNRLKKIAAVGGPKPHSSGTEGTGARFTGFWREIAGGASPLTLRGGVPCGVVHWLVAPEARPPSSLFAGDERQRRCQSGTRNGGFGTRSRP